MNLTNEEKQLLLQVLCAMLPHGVKVQRINSFYRWRKEVDDLSDVFLSYNSLVQFKNDIEYLEIKPYLRPLSSMTEKEKKELWAAIDKDMPILESSLDAPIINEYKGRVYRGNPIHYELDFLISNHFDYLGLIPKGLALEAPEGMYENK